MPSLVYLYNHQSLFKPRKTIKTVFFVTVWIWPELLRGRRREENFQKTSWKTKKISPPLRPPSLLFFKLVSSTLWPFCCFYLMCASFRSVTAKKDKTLTPTRTERFCRFQWTGNSTRWTLQKKNTKETKKENQSLIHRLNSQVLVSSVWYKVIVNFTICVALRLSFLLSNSWRAKQPKLNMPLEFQNCFILST